MDEIHINMANELLQEKNNAADLVKESIELWGIQKRITEEYKKQNSNLEQLTGLYKNTQTDIISNLKKQYDLHKSIKDVQSEIEDIAKKMNSTSDEAIRSEMSLSLKGMKQRYGDLQKELELTSRLNKLGIGQWAYFITQAINLFKTLDAAGWEFRKTVGYTRDEAYALKQMVQGISIEYMNIGVNANIVNKAIEEAGKLMGGMNNVSKQVVETVSILNAQLGTSVEESSKMLQTFAVLSGSTMDAQTNMLYFAQALSAAAGVNFNQIASDFSKMSSSTLTLVSRLPLAMAKTAVELRRMGTDINTSADASEKLLSFTQNIQDEMEASVLLGHSINLQKARELAYNRDIEGSTKEILRIAKLNNFAHGMDTFQMKAFAAATGRSVEDLLNMVQASTEMDKALHSQNQSIQAAATEYERLRNLNQTNAEISGKNVEYQLKLRANQERLTAISQKWNQILAQAEQLLLPIIDGALSLVIPVLDIGAGLFKWAGAVKLASDIFKYIPNIITNIAVKMEGMGTIFKNIGNVLFSRIAVPLEKLGNIIDDAFLGVKNLFSGFKILGTAEAFLGKLVSPFVKVFDVIKGIFPMLGKFGFLLDFTKLVPGLGEFIMGIQFVYSLITRLVGVWSDKNMSFGDKLLGSIKAVGGAVYDVLIAPFVSAWNWIKEIFIGHSPSELGLGILRGIVSVSAMIFDAITYPFRHAFAWILDKIPGMSKFSEVLKNGAGGIVNSVQNKVTTEHEHISQITPLTQEVKSQTQVLDKKVDDKKEDDKSKYSIDDLYNILKSLNDNLTGGKIRSGDIFLDGSLVSSTLARSLAFKGNFGQNR